MKPQSTKHIEEGAVEKPRKNFRGQNEALSQNDEGYSGHPHLSDGSPRYDHENSSPLGQKPVVKEHAKPVNPPKK